MVAMDIILFLVAFSAALLTFFSGFGLGTLLMPVMLIWFPPPTAIAATGMVHLLNSLLKVGLTYQNIHKAVLLRFGSPAIVASLLGSLVLLKIGTLPTWFKYEWMGYEMETSLLKMLVGMLILVFVSLEYLPSVKSLSFPLNWMPLGGIISGFFGGLTGNQGALRSAFLIKSGMDKNAFVATSAAIACLIDITRLGSYASGMSILIHHEMIHPMIFSVVGALIGSVVGTRLLKKTTFGFVQSFVGLFLVVIALLLIAGVL